MKGGHLEGGHDAVDVLFDGHAATELRRPRVATGNTHGTGCTLASAIAAELAKGRSVPDAVAAAKAYVTAALAHSDRLAIGQGVQRPFNHGFAVADWQAAGRPACDLRAYAVTDPGCNKRAGRWEAWGDWLDMGVILRVANLLGIVPAFVAS